MTTSGSPTDFSSYVRACRKLQRDIGPWAIPAMNLYLATGAWRQAVDSGQDVVDILLFTLGDPPEALRLINELLLPIVAEYNLPDLIVDLRSFRALALSLNGDVAAGRAEISALEPYDVTPDQARDIRHRTQLIEQCAAHQAAPG
jgi:hypothetical protein